MVIIPALLLNTGAKAPTQSLLGEIAVKIGPLEKPFTRVDLHKGFY
ncbi:acid phosphatase [Klebsiella grimontii]|uniref:Acid phosphatase n=3 Tax=Klebsiella TaxID=570 RepID=A0A7H4P0F4_9ENTR|nr:acid phosphatase [Klebsiella grimontii]